MRTSTNWAQFSSVYKMFQGHGVTRLYQVRNCKAESVCCYGLWGVKCEFYSNSTAVRFEALCEQVTYKMLIATS